MHNNKLQALYGIKHNPFSKGTPVESLWKPDYVEEFFFCAESTVLEGGFALISGEPGVGKSKNLQLLAHRLKKLGDNVAVGVMERPQNSISDLYRELGELFGIQLSPNNRYGGFKALRERWYTHIGASLFRPILLIDEAQEMSTDCLNELRLLMSAKFDSEYLLSVVLCGDTRLLERLSTRELLPIGSRIGTRLILQTLKHDMIREYLEHLLEQSGGQHLVTEELKTTLVLHSGGNLRTLCRMGSDLLFFAVERGLKRLDEALYLDVYGEQPSRRVKKKIEF